MSVAAVLLVPADGDPNRLLREGPCGARPPMAHRDCMPDDPWVAGPLDKTHDLNGFVRALVLAWDGEPLWQGYAAALWVTAPLVGRGQHIGFGIETIGALVAIAKDCERRGAGTAVLLDADGREVQP